MTTILDVINKTTPYLEQHGVASPRLTIELLLAHLLKIQRLQLYLDFERSLDEALLNQLRPMVRRCVNGEPLQYITGVAHFYGLAFAVDPRVLIPRPETELLVEAVVDRLKQIGNDAPTVIDVGTGSGCIAVTLAKTMPRAQVYAVDHQADALAVAEANAAAHRVEKRIRFLQSDLLSNIPVDVTADVVVSNPPYIAEAEMAGLPKEVRDFEPVTALAAGEDGLKVYQCLATKARPVLNAHGFLALEVGAGQRLAVQRLFEQQGFAMAKVVTDLQGHERVLILQNG